MKASLALATTVITGLVAWGGASVVGGDGTPPLRDGRVPSVGAGFHAGPQPGPQSPSVYAHPPMTAAEFDKMITGVSNWGRWGKDDQAGAVNLITPEKRKQAAGLVKLGTVVSLAHNEGIRDKRAPAAPNIRHTMMQPSEGGSVVVGSVQLGDHSLSMTHLDALCHILYKGH